MSLTNVELAQSYMCSRLQSLDYFGDIYVAAPRVYKEGDKIVTPKTIHDKIDRALQGLQMTGGKMGAAVRVFQPSFNNKKPNLPGLQGMMTMLCRCEVHPIFNFSDTGTNKYVSEIGFQVLLAGQTRFSNIGSFFADGECFLPYYSNDSKMMTVDILLQCNLAVNPLLGCVTPQISIAGNLVTLTSLTPNAAVWYALDDGSSPAFPGPLETGALLYAGPFTPPAGTIGIVWAAYAPGLAGSSVGAQSITLN